MSTSDDKSRKALTVRPQQATYEVGYGKPPTHSRFAKGQSGNPKGRPKGAKNKLPALNEERLNADKSTLCCALTNDRFCATPSRPGCN